MIELSTVVHEMIHSFGNHHMQSRSDRDAYVMVLEKNMKKKGVGNYRKVSEVVYTPQNSKWILIN